MQHRSQHGHENDISEMIGPKWVVWVPFGVVVAYILGLTVITAQITSLTVDNLMSYSMGYFFVIFSLFKMINLPGFAMGYHEYDLIGKRWYIWGYIAPFVELVLGSLYLMRVDSAYLHIATLLFSLIIVIGVGIKLAKREMFYCACLGTVLKLPLTKISLIEYLLMCGMAICMIAMSGR